MRELKGKKGFTLIELLVVVAIIAILAAIAIPQYNKYRANAMLSNVQQFTKSIANQVASLATTAGQNPKCSGISNFKITYASNNGTLIAHPSDNESINCDQVKVYNTMPSWLESVEIDNVTLTNNGTSVIISGTIGVKSKYDLGDYKFGCKYENGQLVDYSNGYLCHIQ